MIGQQNDFIRYHGSVSIKYKFKNKIIRTDTHNNGTDFLFQRLVQALITGQFTISPSYIGLYVSDSLSGTYTQIAKSTLTNKTSVMNNDDPPVARFGTIISHNQLTDQITVGKYYQLKLLDISDNELANVQINDIALTSNDNLAKLIDGVSMLVEWNMFFTNIDSNLAEFTDLTE